MLNNFENSFLCTCLIFCLLRMKKRKEEEILVLNCLNDFICFLILLHPLLQQTFFGGAGGGLLALFFCGASFGLVGLKENHKHLCCRGEFNVYEDCLLLNISICVDVASLLLYQSLNHFLVLQEARRDKTQSAGVNKGCPHDSNLRGSK